MWAKKWSGQWDQKGFWWADSKNPNEKWEEKVEATPVGVAALVRPLIRLFPLLFHCLNHPPFLLWALFLFFHSYPFCVGFFFNIIRGLSFNLFLLLYIIKLINILKFIFSWNQSQFVNLIKYNKRNKLKPNLFAVLIFFPFMRALSHSIATMLDTQF